MLYALAVLAPLAAGLTRSASAQSKEPNAPSVQELVQGTLARSEAVFSGQILYHLKTGFTNTGKVIEEVTIKLSFSGKDWAIRYPGAAKGGERVSHGGVLIEHALHGPQPDGKYYHNASVANYEPMDKNEPFPPYFAGTFWFKATAEFVRKNADQARLVGAAEVNGVKTQLLEWTVPREQIGSVFHAVYQSARLRSPGILRIYVAPQLGFALPRIEHVSTLNGGELDTVMDAEQFQEVAGGIYFPKKLSMRCYPQKGFETYYVEYVIQRAEKINEEIDEAEFKVTLPNGTLVHDGRSPKGAISFRVGQSAQVPKDLEQMIVPVLSKTPSRRWPFAVGIGGGLGLLVLASLLLIRYRIRRSHALG